MSAKLEPQWPGGTPEWLGDKPERIVLRTQRPVVIITTIAVTTMALATAGGGLLMDPTGLPWALLIVAIFLGLEYVVVGGSVWADAGWVGSSRVLGWWSVPRDEIASLRIGAYRQCCFVRRDGTVAHRTPGTIFGATQLSRLAAYLGVPIYGTQLLSD